MEYGEVELVGALLGGLIVGLLLGLIPWVIARKRGFDVLATVSFVLTLISGLLFGLFLAGPVAIIFIVLAVLWKET